MAVFLKMPRLSDTMDEGVLVRWLKKEGEWIEPGEVVAEVETDKATMELESFDEGYLRRIVVPEGTGVPVGGVLAVLSEEEDEDIGDMLASVDGGPKGETPEVSLDGGQVPEASSTGGSAAEVSAAERDGAASISGEGEGRIKASPLARRMAREHHMDLESIQGTGPLGRIVKRDVERARSERERPVQEVSPMSLSSVPVAAPGEGASFGDEESERVSLSGMRRAIARRMSEAKPGTPHFYLTSEIDMAAAMALRKELNAVAGGDIKISVNDLVLKAAALALQKHPMVNASFSGDHIERHRSVHLGIAVALEDGLITPVIRHAERKSIGRLAAEGRALVDRAQARALRPEEYSGATFTVSNLGMLGIVEFSAIINPPQAAILAVGALREMPVVVDGAVEVGMRMRVTLSCDHRVIDGAVGAHFLKTLKSILETPLRLLL